LHVPMRMGTETAPGLNAILVDHAQRTEPHVFGVVIVGEREGVIRLEPAVIGVTSFMGWAQENHGRSLSAQVSPTNGKPSKEIWPTAGPSPGSGPDRAPLSQKPAPGQAT